MKFLVWNHNDGSRETAKPIESNTAREAAEDFARQTWTPEDGDSLDVTVLRIGADKARLFCLDVDFDVSFYAMEIGATDAERHEDSP